VSGGAAAGGGAGGREAGRAGAAVPDAPSARGGRRRELDGVRAVAALLVLVFHAVGFYARGSGENAWARPWVGRLDVGVAVFFLLSGYLLYGMFLRGRIRVGAYALRRAARIVPAYWVALTVATVVLPLREVGRDVPLFYGFAQVYDASTAGEGLGQAWTLCVEVVFYAFLPVWALVIARTRALWPLVALFCASIAYKVLILRTFDGSVGPLEPALIALPAFLDWFALGMGVALLETRGVRFSRPWAWALGATGLYVASCISLWDARLDAYSHTEWLIRHSFYAVIALCVLNTGVAGARALRWAPLARLGEISYGIYLYHLFVLALLSRWGLIAWERHVHPYVLWTGFALAGSVLLATLSWRLVERPAWQAARRASAPRVPAPVAPSPSPARHESRTPPARR
jgi:peptidoglycan/LPS O-acetylase OafA/YrhL